MLKRDHRPQFVVRVVMNLAAAVPFVVVVLMLVLVGESGVYWIVPGVTFSFLVGILNA